MREGCAVLDWAASGAMALTGRAGATPVTSPAPAFAMLGQVTAQFARVTGETGTTVRADPAELITGRAALAGLTRGGQVSAGRASFLLRSADGWCAVTLSRPDDLAAVPAIIGALGLDGAGLDGVDLDGVGPDGAGLDGAGLDSVGLDSVGLAGVGRDGIVTRAEARSALAAAAARTSAEDFAAAAQLLGVPAAALPASALPASALPGTGLPGTGSSPSSARETALAAAAGWPPWRPARIAAPLPGARLAGAVVADLSSMWAGPLCARLLGLAGAEVIKVESPARPDGARSGNREFFDWLHAGHRSLSVDFRTGTGRAALAALLEVADVVIESSRPRALAAVGLAPEMVPHRRGQVWLSITGYGRGVPDRVAFGDDAAVAGGLVGWTGGGSSSEPVFCADAIADPLSGACGALAVALSRAAGGGELIDLSMRDVAAAFTGAALDRGPDWALDHGPHEVLPGGTVLPDSSVLAGGTVLPDETVACPRSRRQQAVLPPRRPAPPAGAAHAPELGADTPAVLGWLAGQHSAC